MGTELQERADGKQAVERGADGRIRLWHLVFLLALLVSPGLALWRLAPSGNSPLLLGYWVVVSLTTYALYALDKQRARIGEWRVPEIVLHFAELAGGWPGAFLAQRRLRHKSSKVGFQIVFWLIVLVHLYAVTDYQLDWRLTRAAQQFLRQVSTGRTQP